jgi:apolipoprotein N-acyltransferase
MKNYKAWLLCLLSAVTLALAQPLFVPWLFGTMSPYQFLMGALALVGYVPLWLVISERGLRATFIMSFATITLQYTLVLYWIYIACHDYGDVAPLSSAAITVLLPMEIALVAALFFCWGRWVSKRLGWPFFIIAPLAITAMEYFRNYLPFGGFPWGNCGYAVGRVPEFLQLASLIGVYGLVCWVGIINTLICWILSVKAGKLKFLWPVLGVASIYFFGLWRLNSHAHEFAPSLRIALLQGNIPQDMKNRARMYSDEIIAIYGELQTQAVAQGAELIIWPEAAHPKTFDKNILGLNLNFERPVAAVIGATSFGYDEGTKKAHFHNSAFIQNYEGHLLSRYDKSHLVPFGEYVPWPLENIVGKIVPGLGAYRPGARFEPVQVHVNKDRPISIGTTVCYEGIFPEISRAYAQKDATLLVNITNDAWYGESSAPFQHLLMYQLRSAETGRPYARATNSGISAWIDAYGRIQKQSGLFTREVLVENVPLVTKKTIYTTIGDIVPMLCSVILLALTCLVFMNARKHR